MKLIQLLNYKKELEAEGKCLAIEDPEKNLDLLKYEVLILDHIRWERRNCYFSLLNNFINKKINLNDYMVELFKLRDEGYEVFEKLKMDLDKLKTFEPNPESKGFSDMSLYLCSDCEVFEEDPDLRENYELSEDQLRDSVKKIVSEFQKYL